MIHIFKLGFGNQFWNCLSIRIDPELYPIGTASFKWLYLLVYITFCRTWMGSFLSKLVHLKWWWMSMLSVLSLEHKSCYIQKHPPADNQLWMKEDVEANNNGFYLVSKLDPSCKITIQVTISPVHFTQTCLDNLQ